MSAGMSTEQSLRDEDRRARQAAEAEFSRPVILEAGAGTGKTETLVNRLVSWALGPGWDQAAQRTSAGSTARHVLERMAALTFTDKAAHEMAERLAKKLVARAASTDAAIAQRATQLGQELDAIFVGTFHAFCRHVLQRFPFEAGLHPAFVVDADGLHAMQVIREVVARRVDHAFAEKSCDPHWFRLAEENIGPDRLVEIVSTLARKGVSSSEFDQDPFSQQRVTPLVERIRSVVARAKALWLPRIEKGPAQKLKVALRIMNELGTWERIADALHDGTMATPPRVDTSITDKLRDWAKRDWSKAEGDCLGDVADETVSLAAEMRKLLGYVARLNPPLSRALAHVLTELLNDVNERLRAEGICSYDDLLTHSARVLTENRGVRRVLQQSYSLLAVDEFQDTDATQCAIVASLALDDQAESTPNLMIVGDPKQSIYGWRNADLAAYETFIEKVIQRGGVRYRLSVNHRSVPAILAEVDRVIAPVMQAEPGMQPPFQPLFAANPVSTETVAVEHWVSWDERLAKTDTITAREIEARAVARDLRERQQQEGFSWDNVAILMRARTNQSYYIDALRAEGIPFVVERDATIVQQREVQDAAALVRTILDPHDQLALVAWIRSPSIGVPDAALWPLWTREFPAKIAALGQQSGDASQLDGMIADVAQGASWGALLQSAIGTLAALRASARSDDAELFLDQVSRLTFIDLTAAARSQGKHRIARLRWFFSHLLDLWMDPIAGGPDRVLAYLRGPFLAPPTENRGSAPHVNKESNAVRVMTVHGAKGLTFAVVYVVSMDSSTTRPFDWNPKKTKAERENGRWEYLIAGCPSPEFDRVVHRDEHVARAEAVRMLYVAMTRPAKRLVLAGCWPESAGKKRETLIDLVSHRGDIPDLRELFEATQRTASESIPRDFDEKCRTGDVLWRFPGALGPSTIAPMTRSELDPRVELSPEKLRAWVEQRQTAQRQAQAHMQRHWLGTPSGLHRNAMNTALASDNADNARASADARTIGIAVHRLFERLPLDVSVDQAMSDTALPVIVQAQQEIPDQLARVQASRLLRRWDGLRSRICGREVPILGACGNGPDDAVGAIVGTLDMLYQDPESGAWVVVDYKTDAVSTEAEVLARAESYAGQGQCYVDAVRSYFQDGRDVHFELWFWHADRRVRDGRLL